MNALNANSQSLIDEIILAKKYKLSKYKPKNKSHKRSSSIAFAYEKARNAVEYRDERSIRQAAIERILKRRIFLNQSNTKIANLLLRELMWARYIESSVDNDNEIEKLKKIIDKYREAGLLVPNSSKSAILVGLCACEIDESLNFDPESQIIINYVSTTLESIIDFDEKDKSERSIQIYIATERSFARNSEILIRYKLLKVLHPAPNDPIKLLEVLDKIETHLNYKNKDLLRRKVLQISPPFNLIRDFVSEEIGKLAESTENTEKLNSKLTEILNTKYKETGEKVVRASKRSIIYIFLTKMVMALLIEIPLDILFGSINFLALSINVLFPPSLMILFNTRVKLPDENNTAFMIDKVNEYFYANSQEFEKEKIEVKESKGLTEKIFYFAFLTTSFLFISGLIYLLNLLHFNFVSQVIFLFFLSVVSFFAYRVKEISNDYLLSESTKDSLLETLLDYLFLPIIKSGQWLSSQVSKINILSFIFDFIIEAPLKTFLEIFEQWLHFVRVKKEEFLG
ncbi:MAG: hypothetical protein WA152_04165 [Microgenomates group bacterium]